MLLETIAFMLLGVIVGTATGLLPGLHPNAVFALVLSSAAFLSGFPALCTMVFIISLSISNIFLDFIPSILFGAPDPDSCLAVLPGHQMLMEGRGYEAIMLSVAGGIGAMATTAITLPLLLFAIPSLYSHIHPFIHLLLAAVVCWTVLTEKGMKKMWALAVFLMSGMLGLITLNTLSDQALFPALTGLFGISGLLVSLYGKTTLPKQKRTPTPSKGVIKGSLAGWVAGMFAGILPGIGSSQAGMVVSQIFRAKAKEFLSALGGINAANIIFTLVAFYTIGKTRSGAVSAIAQLAGSISMAEFLFLVAVGMLVTFVSAIITLKAAGVIVSRMQTVNYRKINISIIIFLASGIAVLTGLLGLLISCAATALGVAAIRLGVKRSHMMGFLIFPTILYFSGHLAIVSYILGV